LRFAAGSVIRHHAKVSTLSIRKRGVAKVVCTTAYDAAFTSLADAAGVDLIIEGDALATRCWFFRARFP
jgi:ketopantoate hydroxymethyltransferase